MTLGTAGTPKQGYHHSDHAHDDSRVRVRCILPRYLAEQLDVIAHADWISAQEVIRDALEEHLDSRAYAHAKPEGVDVKSWWERELEDLRKRAQPRFEA